MQISLLHNNGSRRTHATDCQRMVRHARQRIPLLMGPSWRGRARMTLFSRTSNPFLPLFELGLFRSVWSIFLLRGQVRLQLTRSSTAPTPSLITICRKVSDHATSSISEALFALGPSCLLLFTVCGPIPSYTIEALRPNSPQVVQFGPEISGRLHCLSDSQGPMPTVFASPTHQPISARCGIEKPITQILGLAIGSVSSPVLFYILLRFPYPDPLPDPSFYYYLGLPVAPFYTTSYPISESLLDPSRFYGCSQGDQSSFRTSPSSPCRLVHLHIHRLTRPE
ncbi:unnamed protein product [Acanthosepion pharaonis]|uniref:Uncharacterized protein n=1 Tax=Acanthosepion pharaonis TaxID=158019 RepID=A0A812BND4_ACAPH|nr:unnamed protein product [Sepia pharaonis]